MDGWPNRWNTLEEAVVSSHLPGLLRPSIWRKPMARSARRLLTLVAALAVSALGTGAAMADSTPSLIGSLTTTLIGGNCGATTTAFAPFGDPNSYYLISNGGFEAGGAGWALAAAKGVARNEPLFLHSQAHRSSFLLSNCGHATSPPA